MTDRVKVAAVNIFRFATAITFIVSGFVKAVDPAGTQYKIEDYLGAIGIGGMVPDMVEIMVAVVLSGVEFTLGMLLLMAIRRRLVSRLIVVFMIVMTAITIWLYVADPVQDCGCFGDAIKLSNGESLTKNVVLLVMAIVVAWRPLDMVRFLSRSTQWIVINYTAIFILVVSGYSLYYLPLMDFRPYKVGVDLREATTVKEGEYLPEIDDFFLMNENLDDVTKEVLGYEGYTYMLISPYLDKADDSLFDEINSLFDYAKEEGHRFACITASSDDAIERWKDCTGARYPFMAADEVMLKTIIRSNPGIVLMHDGRIVGKWGRNSLSEELRVKNEELEMDSDGQFSTSNFQLSTVTIMIGWYIVPLLLLTIADRTWAWTKWIRRKQK